jgi:hypothetical protein
MCRMRLLTALKNGEGINQFNYANTKQIYKLSFRNNTQTDGWTSWNVSLQKDGNNYSGSITLTRICGSLANNGSGGYSLDFINWDTNNGDTDVISRPTSHVLRKKSTLACCMMKLNNRCYKAMKDYSQGTRRLSSTMYSTYSSGTWPTKLTFACGNRLANG